MKNNLLLRILDATSESIWVFDRDGMIRFANKTALERVGKGSERIIGRSIGSLLPAELYARRMERLTEVFDSGEPVQFEDQRDGIHFHHTLSPIVDYDGQSVYVVSLSQDVSERKKAEQALRASEEQFRVIFEMASVGMSQADSSGRILRANRKFAEIVRRAPDQLIGKPFWELTHPDDREWDQETFRKAWNGELPYYLVEKRYLLPDGTVIWVRVNAAVVRDPSGEPIRTVTVIEDITERKKAEKALTELNQILEQRVKERTSQLEETVRVLKEKDAMLLQQSRLAAMGEMLNHVAHQWRQPLNVLGLHLQKIPLFYEGEESGRQALARSVERAMELLGHMSRTIDDFRNFFKPDRCKAFFSIADAVRSTVNLVHDSFTSHNIAIHVHVEENLLIYGFFNEFSQALLNILQNARDAFLERRIVCGDLHIFSESKERDLVITIQDNAGGIPEEVIGRIFEPYFSTKGAQGTGIGLYMTKMIIEGSMGGAVTVRNEGEGARFSVVLPQKEIEGQGVTVTV